MCKFNLIKKIEVLLFLFGFFAESRGKKEEKKDIDLEKIKFERVSSTSNVFCSCIFIGDARVGKTKILNRFVKNCFKFEYMETKMPNFLSTSYRVVESSEEFLKFHLWDIAGSQNVLTFYVKNAHIIFLVYDVTNKKSFENIENWLSDARTNAPEDAKYVLVGNKIDAGKREVTQEEGKKFAQGNNMTFIEVSAKTGVNLAYTEEGKGMAANNNGLENILKKFAVEFLKNYKKEPQSQNYNYSQEEQSDDKKNDDIPSGGGGKKHIPNNNCCQKCCPGDCCKCEDE